jgi:glycopeptide antibiotics resistance protein
MVIDAAERLLPVLLVLGVAAGALLAWRLTRHPRQHAVDETLRDLALAAAVAAIVVATLLTPSRFGDDAEVELVPFVDIVRALDGRGSLRSALLWLAGNVVLFVPFGMALRWRVPSLSVLAVAGCALALSAGVEVLQATLGGRWGNSTDVITNTIGGALGAIFVGAGVSRPAEG